MSDESLSVESIGSTGEVNGARTFSHEAMATVFRLTLVHEDAGYARQAAMEAFREIDRLERELSRYIENSDISRINHAFPGQSVWIGIDTMDCLLQAKKAHADSFGAFDVTVGALFRCWYGPNRTPRMPTVEEIQNALEKTGMQRIHLNSELLEVRIDTPGIQIDLGAIGKGYALDRVATILQEWKIPSALLNAGSSTILVLDPPPAMGGWPITLSHPLDRSKVLFRFRLAHSAISGSGQAVCRHIIDPRPNKVGPVIGKLATWSMAETGVRSDALSTAFLVMNPDEVKTFCETHRNESAIVVTGQSDQVDSVKIHPYGKWPIDS